MIKLIKLAQEEGKHGEVLELIRSIEGWSDAELSNLLFGLIEHFKPAWLETVVKIGADPNSKDDENNTPLGFCLDLAVESCSANEDVGTYCNQRRSAYLAFIELLAAGADPNLDCQIDNTPLTLAVRRDLPEFVAALLVFGADPNHGPELENKSAFEDARGFAKPRWPLQLMRGAIGQRRPPKV